jgi:hypothetical protein
MKILLLLGVAVLAGACSTDIESEKMNRGPGASVLSGETRNTGDYLREINRANEARKTDPFDPISR